MDIEARFEPQQFIFRVQLHRKAKKTHISNFYITQKSHKNREIWEKLKNGGSPLKVAGFEVPPNVGHFTLGHRLTQGTLAHWMLNISLDNKDNFFFLFFFFFEISSIFVGICTISSF